MAALAHRPAGYRPAGAPASTNLIRLPQVIGELMSVGRQSKKVAAEAGRLVAAPPAASAAVPSAPSVSVKRHDREENAR